MRRAPEWQIQRIGVPRSDGARRWDAAYHLLLTWAQARESTGQALPAPYEQEDDDADRIVCAGVDDAPTTEPDD